MLPLFSKGHDSCELNYLFRTSCKTQHGHTAFGNWNKCFLQKRPFKFVTKCIRQYYYDRIGGSFRYNYPTAQTIATSVSLNKQAPLKQKLEKL